MENKRVNFHDTSFYNGAGAYYGKLPVGLSLNMNYPDGEGYMSLELSAGTDKMYRITDAEGFFESFAKGRSYYFSKNFIFEPDRMYFAPADRRLLEFIKDLKENRISDGGETKGSLFSGGKVKLGAADRGGFLDLIWQDRENIRFTQGGKKLRLENDARPEISVRKEENCSILTIDYSVYGDFLPAASDFRYVSFPETEILARLPVSRREFFRQLFPYRNEEHRIRFQINSGDIKFFRKNFLEKYGKELDISLDGDTKNKLSQNSLISKIYFDVANAGIVSKVEFCYGETIINPLNGESNDKSIREYDEEKAVTTEMKELGFREYGKLYLLDEVEKIVHLLTDDLINLKKAGQIYYSQDFKKLYVKNPEMESLRLSEDGSVIHMNINLENVSDEELAELLDAIKTGKKYYRLRNGSIVNLRAASSSRFINLINSLEINRDSIQNGIFEIPLNRCLYLENYWKEKGLTEVKVDERFAGLLNKLSGREAGEAVIPESVKEVLRDYQSEGVRWLKTLAGYSFGGILADDMGLGKTLQVLAFLAGENDKKAPGLVVAPTSLLYNWKREAAKFLPELKVLVVEGAKEKRKLLLDCCAVYDLIITSYTTLGMTESNMKSWSFPIFLWMKLRISKIP